jgi:hypothetical protein
METKSWWRLTAVLALASSACGGPTSGGARSDGAARSCAQYVESLLGTFCNAATEKNLGSVQMSPVKAVAVLHRECDAVASVQPKLTELDACMTRIGGNVDAEKAAQQARLPSERAKEPAVRADPNYIQLSQAWQDATHNATIAADNVEVVTREGRPNALEYQARLDRANKTVEAIAARLRALFESYGIDVRDAGVLGLW